MTGFGVQLPRINIPDPVFNFRRIVQRRVARRSARLPIVVTLSSLRCPLRRVPATYSPIAADPGDNGRMLDTHAVARSLTDAELTPAQADAITNAVRLASDHGDHVTSDQFKAGLAELRTEIASLRADLTWRMLAVAGLVIAALRLF